MYNNGYVTGIPATVKYTLNNMKSTYAANKSLRNMNKPQAKPKVVASANSSHPGRIYEDFYFRLVCTKESFGDEPMNDSLIIKFKDLQEKPIPIADVNNILLSVYKSNRDYFEEIKQKACKYNSGVVSFSAGIVSISGQPKRKTYVDKGEQERLLNTGYAIRIR